MVEIDVRDDSEGLYGIVGSSLYVIAPLLSANIAEPECVRRSNRVVFTPLDMWAFEDVPLANGAYYFTRASNAETHSRVGEHYRARDNILAVLKCDATSKQVMNPETNSV